MQVAHGRGGGQRARAGIDHIALQTDAVDRPACRTARHHQRVAGDDLLVQAGDADKGLAATAVDPADRNRPPARAYGAARHVEDSADSRHVTQYVETLARPSRQRVEPEYRDPVSVERGGNRS